MQNSIPFSELLKMMSKGMLQQGNIDLNNRPIVRNPDGTISTIRSTSANFDGAETLVPTIVDGKNVGVKGGFSNYLKTGQHLGKFDTPDNADAWARWISFLSGIGRH